MEGEDVGFVIGLAIAAARVAAAYASGRGAGRSVPREMQEAPHTEPIALGYDDVGPVRGEEGAPDGGGDRAGGVGRHDVVADLGEVLGADIVGADVVGAAAVGSIHEIHGRHCLWAREYKEISEALVPPATPYSAGERKTASRPMLRTFMAAAMICFLFASEATSNWGWPRTEREEEARRRVSASAERARAGRACVAIKIVLFVRTN